MTLPAIKYPVELLRDGAGIYGIGAKEAEMDLLPPHLLLRRDHLKDSLPNQNHEFTHHPVLQMITGGFRHGMFEHTTEERLRKVIYHNMLRRAKLPWPPSEQPGQYPYWSSDPEQQVRNRQVYHGLRLGSLAVVNRLIGKALEEAANQEALKIARRFRFRYRYNIYCAAAQSLRALQLAATFPALAFAVFGGDWRLEAPDFYLADLVGFIRYETVERLRHEAAALIEAGASLKIIADLMHVPMSFRKIEPGAADWTLSSIAHSSWDKRLIRVYMPDSLPRMKLWLVAIHRCSDLGRDFVEWVAKHALEIPGSADLVMSSLFDIKDLVRACRRARFPGHICDLRPRSTDFLSRGEEFVVRPFSADMSLKTVMRLSANWHEAVATNMVGPNYEFPEPWCDGGHSGGCEIIPIANSGDLYREGHAMHHCVGTQGDRVQCGNAYFYSVREEGVRIATLELLNHGGSIVIGDLRGVCNSQVSKTVRRCVESWLHSKKEFRLPAERKLKEGIPPAGSVARDELSEPPF